jgi:outer membrane protein OmpA-like peptidoglycan-associated protein
MGDEFDGVPVGQNVDMNLTAIGGFNINFGGRNFKSFNPCKYLDYINQLNGQVNDLRGALATCGAALAAAEAQLPCPEVVAPECPDAQAPLMSTVRFTINSAKITSTETVNVYNTAQWMKANPDSKVVVKGYADKNTGTAEYNMKLSERRAQAVYDMLTNEYGISADRLTIKAEGSDAQVYDENNWNRIVIFSQD